MDRSEKACGPGRLSRSVELRTGMTNSGREPDAVAASAARRGVSVLLLDPEPLEAARVNDALPGEIFRFLHSTNPTEALTLRKDLEIELGQGCILARPAPWHEIKHYAGSG